MERREKKREERGGRREGRKRKGGREEGGGIEGRREEGKEEAKILLRTWHRGKAESQQSKHQPRDPLCKP